MNSLWQAMPSSWRVSFVSLGLSPGSVVALSIPLTLGDRVSDHGCDVYRSPRISLGALIIALSLLVDSAMTTVDVMTTAWPRATPKKKRRPSPTDAGVPMLTGTLVTIAGFVPIGFARSSAGEYTFSIFAVVTIALIVSGSSRSCLRLCSVSGSSRNLRRADARAPLRLARVPFEPGRRMRMRWITIAVTLACFAAALLSLLYVPRQFFPPPTAPSWWSI